MLFTRVLILTLLIIGTFAKDSIENIEARIEALERKSAALTMANEMEDIGTNRGILTNFVSLTYFFPKKLTCYEAAFSPACFWLQMTFSKIITLLPLSHKALLHKYFGPKKKQKVAL